MAVLAFLGAVVDRRPTTREWAHFSQKLECSQAHPSQGGAWGCHRDTQGVREQPSRGLGLCRGLQGTRGGSLEEVGRGSCTCRGWQEEHLSRFRNSKVQTGLHLPALPSTHLSRGSGAREDDGVSQVSSLGVEHGGKDRCGRMGKGAGECP